MSPFDDQPSPPQPADPDTPSAETAASPLNLPAAPAPMPGDPFSLANTAASSLPYFRVAGLPEDLRISWSWPHLLTFIFFGFASLVVIQVGLAIYIGADRHLSSKQLQQALESNPQFIVGSNVLWFAFLLLFLYVTLAVLRDSPFWRSLGWRRLGAKPSAAKSNPWMYFFSGCGLALLVGIASSRVKNTDHMPIQELFKSRSGAFLLMGMAVLVAPLVEETVFRGYLYPLFASKFSRFAERSGLDAARALRFGMSTAILLTGLLFGLLHGAQLAWTWSIVSLLILVGIIFTFARAHTGTVLASFMLHLGYNSMLAVSSIIATKGFTTLPPVK
jgi:membrane protease YdiL (CAAX protease family)